MNNTITCPWSWTYQISCHKIRCFCLVYCKGTVTVFLYCHITFTCIDCFSVCHSASQWNQTKWVMGRTQSCTEMVSCSIKWRTTFSTEMLRWKISSLNRKLSWFWKCFSNVFEIFWALIQGTWMRRGGSVCLYVRHSFHAIRRNTFLNGRRLWAHECM